MPHSLNVEAEERDVAVLKNVVAALQAVFARFARVGDASRRQSNLRKKRPPL